MFSPVLLNAARAYALVSFADGRLDPAEETRFGGFIAGEPALKPAAQADIRAAWSQAVKDVEASQSFGGPLVTIRSEITSAADKALMMRAAQAAVIADTKLELQENVAIQSLAEALGLNPDQY